MENDINCIFFAMNHPAVNQLTMYHFHPFPHFSSLFNFHKMGSTIFDTKPQGLVLQRGASSDIA